MSAPRRVYTLRYECGTQEPLGRTTLSSARHRAREGAQVGWEDNEDTHWHDVSILDARGEVVETLTVAVDPEEPDCVEATHAWEDDGAPGFGGVVRGHGGGVILQARCAHCGLRRIYDTWAQRPDTGEQGLTSVRYERGGRDE